MQLDLRDRGFSYSHDAPLDMRMDQSRGITAADVVNTYGAGQLADVLREYGDEKFAMRIARRIVEAREDAPFTNSARLVELVREAIPAATRRTGGNPAKRTFQALRIEVNGELDSLRSAIPAAIQALAVDGRLVVMSYQSLEDRFVKQVFAEQTTAKVPHGMPVIPAEHQPKLRLLTRGAETPTEQELEENPRSASVRVRALERVAA
jgi:16S rRNA (cytosine1402-N4)-methyltransferase